MLKLQTMKVLELTDEDVAKLPPRSELLLACGPDLEMDAELVIHHGMVLKNRDGAVYVPPSVPNLKDRRGAIMAFAALMGSLPDALSSPDDMADVIDAALRLSGKVRTNVQVVAW